MHTSDTVVGIIGGSGLYQMDAIHDLEEIHIATPFGEPSDAFLRGRMGDTTVVFLPRHGRGHRVSPSELNFRANIWGMKKLGVSRILSVSAVGSLKEEIVPGDFVIVDQFIDRTRHRVDTFYTGGVVAHVMFADPFCPNLREALVAAAGSTGVKVHDGGTYVNMEGPQFSTRAESKLYRSWGADVIGMTNLQEAKLAREAEICYATIAMATDYDCWHEGHDAVTVEQVVATMHANVDHARDVLMKAVPAVTSAPTCGCQSALAHAIMTDPTTIPDEARDRLGLLIDKYV
ncbi:S-methyl-5'-thioadenosine phosphorylase [Planctomycetes bacterium Pla163]|uniref:S-methyl-5'-thioadenosine phosphorylase n=1 Tax=Rohdeia mirabilis TaxID=2528008 RepID=A0A518D250_9BACT|nr:S-methyl-5'-thioadenosine phosphorylase [Planctomycetes bacterium Pla163]